MKDKKYFKLFSWAILALVLAGLFIKISSHFSESWFKQWQRPSSLYAVLLGVTAMLSHYDRKLGRIHKLRTIIIEILSHICAACMLAGIFGTIGIKKILLDGFWWFYFVIIGILVFLWRKR